MDTWNEQKQRIKQKIYPFLNRISLKTQLITLVSITFTLIIICIITYNYIGNRDAIIDQQIQSSTTLLNLESQNLDDYLSEISRYSLLLRHSESFMQSISSSTPLSYEEKNNIQTLLRSNFDSRNDLLSYRLFLLQKADNYAIDSKRHKVQPFYDNYVKALPGYDIFTKKPYYQSIEPSVNGDSFLTYYRTIIRIHDQKPMAIVELTLDKSYIDAIAENHHQQGEFFCFLDDRQRLLYANSPLIDDALIQDTLSSAMKNAKKVGAAENHFYLTAQGVSYLVVYHTSDMGYSIVSYKPLDALDKQVAGTRNVSLVLALIAISLAILLVWIFVRLITNPLSTLAHRLRRVGSGNFTTTADIGGSREIKNLSTDFNSMIHHIDDLIKKNYISAINEKTARLTALEAQLNPHFLYNTLQAISAEAIINKQPRINAMVTSLASMLRYSIKEEDFVTVAQELKHVSDYLSLQHSRFDDRLTYEWNIDEDTLQVTIPKISIQTLVENSISHGMGGDIDRISIYIRAYIEDGYLLIKVRDNGMGINHEQLVQMNETFARDDYGQDKSIGIGLQNLNSRLHILYQQPATLKLESNPGFYTMVTLSIPIEMKSSTINLSAE
ncbi:MAG: histidine kinase [Lachnospiraceae bacterium]|nr:histidine kinase [Lachnospiraceae bacterium]